ncbi:MAG: hypothetical protein E4H30_06400 [Methanomassiliicoccus sp.]|nr:MAG: hypothetical protein E4H30_06400 [Methanomassiliicoccus sp.]
MTSKVRVHMNICEKISTITVTTNEDGNYDVQIATSCPNVKEFGEGLTDLTMEDLVDKVNSRIINRYRNVTMSANCAVPSGVLSAAWLDAGMIARSRAMDKTCNVIEFLPE